MKKTFFYSALIMAFLLIPVTAFAVDPEVAAANAQRFGVWTLLPPLIAILLAFITKNVVLSLFLGILSGTFLLNLGGYNIFDALFKGYLSLTVEALGSLADSWDAGIILQCLTIGGLIALVGKMGGAKAIAEALAKKAKSPKSTQVITWLLGLIIFIDDYANSLIVGPIMRPVTDKMKISREKLAFIIDATAAPIAGIALISTWVAYEVGLIKSAYESINIDANAYGVFVQTIPYRFYNILILAFVLFTAFFLKEFGPMYKAEKRARTTGKLLPDGAQAMVTTESSALEPESGTKLSIWNAIIPIGVLIIASFVGFYYNGYNAIIGGENTALINLLNTSPNSFTAIRECFGASDASIVLFQAALFACIVALIMGVCQKIFSFKDGVNTWIEGIKSLVITGVILLLAWSISGVIKELGTATFLVSIFSESLPPFILPSLIFTMGAIISFATGTSYGTMGILMPLTIPLAFAIVPDQQFVIMNVGAVLTGAIFGDHCSPISDTTILSSMGAGCDHIEHTKTQLFYSVGIGLATILFGYLPVGLGLPVWVVLPISIVIVGLITYFFGKRVDDETLGIKPSSSNNS